MYDPDLHTWDTDTVAIVQDAEIEAACNYSDWQYEVANGDTRLGYDDWLEHNRLVCPEWGDAHRYEEQETWDHRIVIGCNCGHTPPRDDDTR